MLSLGLCQVDNHAFVEAHGRPALHGSGPPAYAGTRNRVSTGRRRGTVDHSDAAQPAELGSDRGTADIGAACSGRHRVSPGRNREHTMNVCYLEVTYRQGRAIAGYYYLPRRPGQRSVRTRRAEGGLLVDYARGGRPIGVEIPNRVARAGRALGQASGRGASPRRLKRPGTPAFCSVRTSDEPDRLPSGHRWAVIRVGRRRP